MPSQNYARALSQGEILARLENICENEPLFSFFSSDLDECSSESPACDINAACLNTVGSFSCACNGGYERDGKICRGIQILDHGSMMHHRYSLEHETSNLCTDKHVFPPPPPPINTVLSPRQLDTQVLDVVFIF